MSVGFPPLHASNIGRVCSRCCRRRGAIRRRWFSDIDRLRARGRMDSVHLRVRRSQETSSREVRLTSPPLGMCTTSRSGPSTIVEPLRPRGRRCDDDAIDVRHVPLVGDLLAGVKHVRGIKHLADRTGLTTVYHCAKYKNRC